MQISFRGPEHSGTAGPIPTVPEKEKRTVEGSSTVRNLRPSTYKRKRIRCFTIDTDLEMEMRTGAATGIAHLRDDLAFRHLLTRFHQNRLQGTYIV